MRFALTALALMLVSLPALADPPKELALIAGTWKPTSMQKGKAVMPAEQIKDLRLTIDGVNYKAVMGDQETDKGKLTVAKSDKGAPKALDIVSEKGEKKTIPAIYELNGETLRVCYGLDGKTRPKEFKPADDNTLLIVYKKVK